MFDRHYALGTVLSHFPVPENIIEDCSVLAIGP